MQKIKNSTFLKWAGGKKRILNELDSSITYDIKRYFEPFLGGGSVFFYIKQKYNPKYCQISDINEDLINTYIAVRDHPTELIRHLSYLKRNNNKSFYYRTRSKFNAKKILGIRRSATFIYLNKTCFNGLYRVNSKNEFNVPYGKYTNPEIYDAKNIRASSKLLQGVNIIHSDYRAITEQIQEGDFIYLDPCYDPIKKTSFTNYTPNKFCELDRIELAKFMNNIKNRGAHAMLSNNDLPEINRIYKEGGFKIRIVLVSRPINSNSKDRGKIPELIITC
jgi:DNA adenine methylase